MTLNILCIPLTGGTNNDGRQLTLGYSVQRLGDGLFLDPAKGVWGATPVVAALTERGRDAVANAPLKGTYVPKATPVWGTLATDIYVILYHNLAKDKVVIARDVQCPKLSGTFRVSELTNPPTNPAIHQSNTHG